MNSSKTRLAGPLSIAAFSIAVIGIVGAVYAHGPRHNPIRHHHVMMNGIPAEYQGITNPLRRDPDNLIAGRTIYDENCAACHGRKGDGRGAAAANLTPAPAQLAGMYDIPMTGMGRHGPAAHLMHGELHHHPGLTHAQAMGGLNLDAYNFWAASEGGQAMGSAMPAFKEILTEKQRWQVLLYIANGFRVEADK